MLLPRPVSLPPFPQTARERIEEQREDALESKLVAERRGRERELDAPFSTGRGGAGNIGGSSRSRSRSRPAHAAAVAGTGHAAAAHHALDGGEDAKFLASRTTTRGSTATGTTVTGGTAATGTVPTLNGTLNGAANGHAQHVYVSLGAPWHAGGPASVEGQKGGGLARADACENWLLFFSSSLLCSRL